MSKLSHLSGIVLLAAATFGATSSPTASSAARPATRPTSVAGVALPFEREIAAFEALDRKVAPTPGGILFYGSSSIRLWKTFKDDFAGLPVQNRGFGGSTATDALRYADRVVFPLHPATIVFYEGDNDLNKGRTPDQLLADYQTFAKLVHAKLPETKIVYVSVKPSPARIDLLPTQRLVNTMLETWIKGSKDGRLSFVDVFKPMLDGKGQPRNDLFGPDHLHMNADGYKLWRTLIGLRPASVVTAVADRTSVK
jgi:lysophospholipase L1-like esterase